MANAPSRIAQTSTEAKKLHKRNGSRLSDRQQRQLERAAELEERAARIREQDERRKAAKKKREERERREKEARQQWGIGLATQLVGFNHTQAQLKSGMEAFLGLKQRKQEEEKRKEMELRKQLEAIADEAEKEPWDDDEVDLPDLNAQAGDQFIDDDLDDDTLLEAHNLVMSDPVEVASDSLSHPQDLPTVSNIPQSGGQLAVNNKDDQYDIQSKSQAVKIDKVEQSSDDAFGPWPEFLNDLSESEIRDMPEPTTETEKMVAPKISPEFIRLHGPVNKAVENLLDKLPEPLVELLSQDISTSSTWDPLPSLLHKLNPAGLPPHRLRIKVGCVVVLLRDLNTSSQLSKSQHLRVLRVEKEWLECLVLDGQLKGTKSFLTRVAFPAKYRNEESFPFQRTQFPIRVCTDSAPSNVAREPLQSFKLPSMADQSSRSITIPKKPPAAASKPLSIVNANPRFKLPGLPASKARLSAPEKPPLSSTSSPLDGWDDFLDSGTQIARELYSDEHSSSDLASKSQIRPPASISDSLPPISTQDFDFSLEDLNDSFVIKSERSQPTKALSPHSKAPSKSPSPTPPQPMKEPPATKLTTALPRLPPSVGDRPGLKRKRPSSRSSFPPPPEKRKSTSHPKAASKATAAAAKSKYQTPSSGTPLESFSDFGLSTQDAASFFDDDEDLSFGSPPIAV